MTDDVSAMLACSQIPEMENLEYPLYASFKFDGFRCLAVKGVAMSRNGKPIANQFVQQHFKEHNLHGFDGELILKTSNDFENVQSAFSSIHGEPNFEYKVFDNFSNIALHFPTRYHSLFDKITISSSDRLSLVTHYKVITPWALSSLYESALGRGYEGLVTRSMKSPYKFGRSTFKQQWMMKLKPIKDMEVTIVAIEELMHNADTSTHHQANLIPGGTFGAFVCRLKDGDMVKVGTGKGLTTAKRQEYWNDREELIGRQLTISYQELTKYGIPRFPRIKGLRPEQDD